MKKRVFFTVLVLLCAGLFVTSCDDGLESETNVEQSGNDDAGSGNEENAGGVTNDPIVNSSAGVSLTVKLRDLTETSVTFYGDVELADNSTAASFGVLYSEKETFTAATAQNLPIENISGTNYSVATSSLKPVTTYYYTSYIKQGSLYKYAEIKSFTTLSLVAPTLNAATDITTVSATISGTVSLATGPAYDLEYGFQYSTYRDFSSDVASKKITDIDSEKKFSLSIVHLTDGKAYYYRSYIRMNGTYGYGEIKSFTTVHHNMTTSLDLSSSQTANSYIVSKTGTFKFKTVQGNSSTSVGSVSKAEVLWESFGTSVAPSIGDLIEYAVYKDGYIGFQTADTFKEGNAVIAAKDAAGNILWSWHIWLTDQPQSQEYYNNAGTMMDRNLGATSATPGDVGALGLLYQWGRKDPFLGSSSISSSTTAKSTISWPSSVSTSSSRGTVSYVTANPTTFVTASSSPYDWHYSSRDNTLWTTSDKTKSIYDPCPAGWRVPDGGSNGIWSTSIGSSSPYTGTYDRTNEGMNFSGKFGSASPIWYPASGCRYYDDGGLSTVGNFCDYWSASPGSLNAYNLYFTDDGRVRPSYDSLRAYGYSVRCLQESK